MEYGIDGNPRRRAVAVRRARRSRTDPAPTVPAPGDATMRAVLEALPYPACTLSADGQLVAVDEAFSSLADAGPDEPAADALSTVVGADAAADLLRVVDADGPPVVRRECAVGSDGPGPGEASCMRVRDAGRHAALCRFRTGPSPGAGPAVDGDLLEALPVAALTLKPDGSVDSWNRAAERALGWTDGDVIGDRPPFLLPRSGQRWQAVRERVHRGERVTAVELPVRTASGTVRAATVWASPLADGDMLAVVDGSGSPSEQTQQLRLLDRVLRHNVRNDVNVVLGHAERLAEELDDPSLTTSVDAIRDRSDAIIDLSEKARAFTDVIDAEHELESVDIASITREVVSSFRAAHPGVSFVLEGPRTAHADAIGPVQTAIANLVENAVVHNDSGEPQVTVTVGTARARGHEYVEVTVADNGPGIPEPERAVFVEGREDPLDHGSGLGLWLVYWVVKKSDGQLRFDENDPRGSVLTVRLARSTDFVR